MTGTAKHTPGPWFYDPTDRTIWFDETDPITCAELVDGDDRSDPEQIDSDGRLIAAAPDLLAALKTAQRFVGAYQLLLERGKNTSDARFAGESFDECARAIAKAEGREG